MSTIKTTYLQHPSAGSPSLTLASSGAVAINGSMTGAGLDHITTQSFSAAASVSIDNCFSSNYDNYRVIFSYLASTGSTFNIRLRSSGVDSTTLYSFQLVYASGTTLSARRTTSATAWETGGSSGDVCNVIDLFGPAISGNTLGSGFNSYADIATHSVGLRHAVSSSYDGFSLIVSSGTMTGIVRIYGYKNS